MYRPSSFGISLLLTVHLLVHLNMMLYNLPKNISMTTATSVDIFDEIHYFCSFKLNRLQEKEFCAINRGAKGLNRDIFLVKSLYDFIMNYNTDTSLHYEYGKCNVNFDVKNIVNPTLYMLATQFWFHVIHSSSLFSHGALYFNTNGTQGKEFVVLFETGHFFFCGSSMEDKYHYIMRLISAINDMSRMSSVNN